MPTPTTSIWPDGGEFVVTPIGSTAGGEDDTRHTSRAAAEAYVAHIAGLPTVGTRSYWHVTVNAQTQVNVPRSQGPDKPRLTEEAARFKAVRIYMARRVA